MDAGLKSSHLELDTVSPALPSSNSRKAKPFYYCIWGRNLTKYPISQIFFAVSFQSKEFHLIMSNSRLLDIRPIDENTQQQAKTLILCGLEEYFGFIDETLNPDLENIVANYVRRGHIFLIGMIADNVVCTGGLVEESPLIGQIVRMSVAKAYRRQGFGAAILQHLTNFAKQRGYQKLLVETNNDWYDAIGFYKRLGFAEYDRDETSVHMVINLN